MPLVLNLALEKKISIKKEQRLFFACAGVIEMLTASQCLWALWQLPLLLSAARVRAGFISELLCWATEALPPFHTSICCCILSFIPQTLTKANIPYHTCLLLQQTGILSVFQDSDHKLLFLGISAAFCPLLPFVNSRNIFTSYTICV